MRRQQQMRERKRGVIGMRREDDGVNLLLRPARLEGLAPEDEFALIVKLHQFSARFKLRERPCAVAQPERLAQFLSERIFLAERPNQSLLIDGKMRQEDGILSRAFPSPALPS